MQLHFVKAAEGKQKPKHLRANHNGNLRFEFALAKEKTMLEKGNPACLPVWLPARFSFIIFIKCGACRARATRRIRNTAWGSVCFAPANRRVLSLKFDSVRAVQGECEKGRGMWQCSLGERCPLHLLRSG